MIKRSNAFLIASILSIFLLFLIQNFIQVKKQDLNYKNIDEKIEVSGKIKQINYGKDIISIKLNNINATVIIFTDNFIFYKSIFRNNQEIKIQGRIDFYNQELQIIADKIWI
ncbi:MAG: hypothetical protein ACOYT4_01745 [Nanoarchaeota archaeon]